MGQPARFRYLWGGKCSWLLCRQMEELWNGPAKPGKEPPGDGPAGVEHYPPTESLRRAMGNAISAQNTL